MRRIALLCWLALLWPIAAMANPASIRIGLTPAILHDRHALMNDLRSYFEEKTQRPVELVLRNNYRQIIDLMIQEELDFAWVSAYPFVYLRQHAHLPLLATPLFQGRPYFRGYLIVPSDDRHTQSLLQLQGRIFAFADPYSHTGHLVPRYELHLAGKDAGSFFARTFFTGGHKKVVQAVASGLADGGYVDSFVWDTLAVVEPELTKNTRIVSRSGEYGFPPLVASRRVSAGEFATMRRILLEMSSDPHGAELLKQLNIDGFVAGDPGWYDEVARMMRAMGDQ